MKLLLFKAFSSCLIPDCLNCVSFIFSANQRKRKHLSLDSISVYKKRYFNEDLDPPIRHWPLPGIKCCYVFTFQIFLYIVQVAHSTKRVVAAQKAFLIGKLWIICIYWGDSTYSNYFLKCLKFENSKVSGGQTPHSTKDSNFLCLKSPPKIKFYLNIECCKRSIGIISNC